MKKLILFSAFSLLSFAMHSCTADDIETSSAKTKVVKEKPITEAQAGGPGDGTVPPPPPPPPKDN